MQMHFVQPSQKIIQYATEIILSEEKAKYDDTTELKEEPRNA
jgi:hypothetical protein